MNTSEQKELCIKLYLEGSHTIKDILERTGLKYAPSVYQILDEAGIPRKRKSSVKVKPARTITIEDSRMRFLSGMCKLYNNEPENPYGENEDPFKRYMWRNEWKIMQDAQDPKFVEQHGLNDPRNWSNYFNNKIKAYIELWTNPKNREYPRQWYSKYCEFKKPPTGL